MMTDTYRQRLFGLLALLLAALLTIPPAGVRAQDGGVGPIGDVPPPPAVADPGQTVDENWWAEAQAAIEAEEYEITWQEGLALAEASAAYQAPNRAQGLRTYFLPGGIRVVPRSWAGDEARAWQLGLSLANAASAELAPEGNRITYRRPGGVTEWVRNEPAGLVQGFEVAAGVDGQVVLTLTVDGEFAPILADDGQAVDFVDAEGAAVLRYAGLLAGDATGRDLPARLALPPTEGASEASPLLNLIVDATGAAYPLVVTATLTSFVAPAAGDGLSFNPTWTAESDQAGALFGFSVATAEDVNGDDYADVIVGAPNFDSGQTDEGRAFVYHGSSGGLGATPAWTAESDQAGAFFGGSVATAGDVNGDGYADVLVGARFYDNGQPNEGRAYVYHGSIGGLGASPVWTAESDRANDYFGFSVATAGDVNGDGYADVIVGAPYYDNGQTTEGRAYVFHGTAGGLRVNPAWSAESNQSDARFGESVASAGDVNGDGYADVVVGARFYDNGQRDEGQAYVYHGSAGGLGASPAWTAESNREGALFGGSVATAGDVNHDGYADLIVGAESYEYGRAFVYHGSAGGLGASPVWTAEGNQYDARFSSPVATAGDVNGDGYADVIVGAPYYDNGQEDEGQAYIYNGSVDGLSASPARTTLGPVGGLFGLSVATAGDVNGDGYADVIVGAPYYDNGQQDEGRAHVYHGSAGGLSISPVWTAESNQAQSYFGFSVATAGDVNGDGYADVIVGAFGYDSDQANEGRAYVYLGSAGGLGATPAWTAESDQSGTEFGESVASAGDVNGDGYADVIVAARHYDNGQTGEGRAYVYHGSAGGLGATPAWTAESNQSGAGFGEEVATAGDVNGDGYADVVVGARFYDNGQQDEGRSYVYHGSAGGLSPNPAWTAESNQAQSGFGSSVGTAGDVNGDGYADVIVGAFRYDSDQANEGRAYVYLGSTGGLGASPAWTAEGNQTNAYFGFPVATAGDVNGDGYADIIVSADLFLRDDGSWGTGRVYVYHGSAGGLGATPAWTAESDQLRASFGMSVATAGDVNGDGYADVVVGAPNYDRGQQDEGRAHVYHGSAGGLGRTPAWRAESNQAGASLGQAVATAGDVNGDGYADVVVGSPNYDNGQADEGRAYVYYGKAGGLSASPAWTAEGDQIDAYFGVSVATAGDINGDGYVDVIVGAGGYNNGQSDEGRAYVYHGTAGGLSANPAWSAESNQTGARFGQSVASAGDVNGDGYADVVVGARFYDNGQTDEGRAFVYHGSAGGLSPNPAWTAESNQAQSRFGFSVATAGDVNGDGYAEVIVGAPDYDGGQADEGRTFVYNGSAGGLSANPAWIASSGQAGARFGVSAAPAGDVNGDGFADVIVGARSYDNGQTDEGRAFVYRGAAGGLSANPAWTAEGNRADASFGVSVATAGDVNGDGYADVIVGASDYTNGQLHEGRAFVFHGTSGGLGVSPAWTAERDQPNAAFGQTVATAGDVNGDGYADVIVGAYRYDSGQVDEGRAYVYLGAKGGVTLLPRQRRADDAAPIAPGGKSDRPDGLRLALLGRSPFGRGLVKLEWEVKPLGVPFNGRNIGRSSAWISTGTAGASLNELVTGLRRGTPYHWRVRLRYHPVTSPFQQTSRWITVPWNGWNETDLRTRSGSTTWLPAVLKR